MLLVPALVTTRPIDLGAIASGLGRDNLRLALAAVAHAGGSHEHDEFQYGENGQPIGFIHPGTLYPWPED